VTHARVAVAAPSRDPKPSELSANLRVMAWPGLGAKAQNPYTWLLYSHLAHLGVQVRDFTPASAVQGGYDVLHAHWPEKALNAASWTGSAIRATAALAIVEAARLHGARVVWTAHNAEPHDSRHPRLERWFWSAFVRQVDAVIHLSTAGRLAVEARYPALADRPQVLVSHGHFRGAYPDTVTQDEARRTLGIPAEARVITFIGKVRRYKNVPQLVRTVRALPPCDGEVILLVAGASQTRALAEEILGAAGADPRVRLKLDHIPEAEVQCYLRAADLVVLPFSEITNSGSALLALSFDRPVLLPALGAMSELQALVGDDWVRTYHGAIRPDVLTDALRWAARRRDAAPDLDQLDWPLLARQTLSVYAGITRRCERSVRRTHFGVPATSTVSSLLKLFATGSKSG
jgi:beta-1,4-mannosyltransferase